MEKITVEALVQAPIEKVWAYWNTPSHVTQWNHASDDWHSPTGENDLRPGGHFKYRMEAKDGSFGFDFGGIYDEITPHELIRYTLGDGRKVDVRFKTDDGSTKLTETFESESQNPVEMQRNGWQAILDNFKKYAEDQAGDDRLRFEILIDAPASKVYQDMLADDTYREWTGVFNPTSHYKGSWEKGSKILFVGSDKDGNFGGMVSRIRENIPNEYVSIEHLGIVKETEEITTGPDVEAWAGATENYRFTNRGQKTLLQVDMDTNNDFKAYFEEIWPKALEKLKSVCERD